MLPILALAALALLQFVGVATDAIAVREAAAAGARAAAAAPTSEVTQVVTSVLGADRDVDVKIIPDRPTAGDMIKVRVTMSSRFGPLTPSLTAVAASRGEPALGRG